MFENQGEFTYKVPLVKLQNISVEELNEKKLIALLPFQLLKLRKKIENLRTKENLDELQSFVINDIIESIQRNGNVGNISRSDALDLIDLTKKLYMKIYSKYKELEEFTVRLYDQSMELASDKYEKTIEELEEELELMSDKLKKVESLREENDGLRANLAAKDEKVKELEQTICNLEIRLKELEQK